jgi:hypothetical protein
MKHEQCSEQIVLRVATTLREEIERAGYPQSTPDFIRRIARAGGRARMATMTPAQRTEFSNVGLLPHAGRRSEKLDNLVSQMQAHHSAA